MTLSVHGFHALDGSKPGHLSCPLPAVERRRRRRVHAAVLLKDLRIVASVGDRPVRHICPDRGDAVSQERPTCRVSLAARAGDLAAVRREPAGSALPTQSATGSIGSICSGFPRRIPASTLPWLREFRSRFGKGGAESLLSDRSLVLCREQGFLDQHGRRRTDSIHVLGAVRTPTRLARAIETLRTALDALAVAAPDRLRAHADPVWAERHERRGGLGRARVAARSAGRRHPAPRLGAELLPAGRRCRPIGARQTSSPALAHRS